MQRRNLNRRTCIILMLPILQLTTSDFYLVLPAQQSREEDTAFMVSYQGNA